MITLLHRLLYLVIAPVWVLSALAMIYVMGFGATVAALFIFAVSFVSGFLCITSISDERARERDHELQLEKVRNDLYDRQLPP